MGSNEVNLECYCCHKELKKSEGTYISATPSGKCNDGTKAENRLVCKGCRHEKR